MAQRIISPHAKSPETPRNNNKYQMLLSEYNLFDKTDLLVDSDN